MTSEAHARPALSDAREIAELVPMPRLLDALSFRVNERTRRCACVLHGGSNPTAFSWREDGRWHCHSCGRGGDKITLVREARSCSFRDAVVFLAALAGVDYRERRVSAQDIKRARERRQRAEGAAWELHDRIVSLRQQALDRLHRAERLCARIGAQLRDERDPVRQERLWDRLARIAPAQTRFLAEFEFLFSAKPAVLAQFAFADAAERRGMILEGTPQNELARAA